MGKAHSFFRVHQAPKRQPLPGRATFSTGPFPGPWGGFLGLGPVISPEVFYTQAPQPDNSSIICSLTPRRLLSKM